MSHATSCHITSLRNQFSAFLHPTPFVHFSLPLVHFSPTLVCYSAPSPDMYLCLCVLFSPQTGLCVSVYVCLPPVHVLLFVFPCSCVSVCSPCSCISVCSLLFMRLFVPPIILYQSYLNPPQTKSLHGEIRWGWCPLIFWQKGFLTFKIIWAQQDLFHFKILIDFCLPKYFCYQNYFVMKFSFNVKIVYTRISGALRASLKFFIDRQKTDILAF